MAVNPTAKIFNLNRKQSITDVEEFRNTLVIFEEVTSYKLIVSSIGIVLILSLIFNIITNF